MTADDRDDTSARGDEGGREGARHEGAADPGSYIGRKPERAADTIPGGVRDDDQRVAANSSQGTGVGRPDVRGQSAEEPTGHRDGDDVSDSQLREAGQNR